MGGGRTSKKRGAGTAGVAEAAALATVCGGDACFCFAPRVWRAASVCLCWIDRLEGCGCGCCTHHHQPPPPARLNACPP